MSYLMIRLVLLLFLLTKASGERWLDQTCRASCDILNPISLQCSSVDVPLFHEDTGSPKIPIYVERMVPDPSKDGNVVVWFFQGGPGVDSSAMPIVMQQLYSLFNNEIAVYTFDVRGTGESSPLWCSNPQDIRKCIRELQRAQRHPEAYTVRSIVEDLHLLVQKFKDGKDVYLYGRYLSIYSDTVTGVILDGVLSQAGPTLDQLESYDRTSADEAGKALLHDCKNNEYCSSILKDPEASLRELYANLQRQKCPSFYHQVFGKDPGPFPDMEVRHHLAVALQESDYSTIFQAIRHSVGCGDAGPSTSVSRRLNTLLHDNYEFPAHFALIVFSELWPHPTPTQHELLNRHLTSLFNTLPFYNFKCYCDLAGSRDANCRGRRNGRSYLNTVDFDISLVAKAPVNGGVMMLHGRYDAQTPLVFCRSSKIAIAE